MALLIVTIIGSVGPFQASGQSGGIGNGQGANSNSSGALEHQQSDRDLTFRELFAKVNSSVVQITSSRMGNNGNSSEHRTAIGSGFIIDTEGHVATNYHVIANSRNVSVAFSDGSIYAANVIGSDAFSDSAVIELQGVPQEKLIPLPFGNSSNLAVGDEVIAIGSPYGLAGSMSTGVVSGLGRLIPSLSPPNNHTNNNETIATGGQAYSIPNIIQTDAAINPGNSGGPLLNLNGEVVGINSAGISASPFGGSSGVGFAIPSDTLKVVLPALIADGYYVHPWIGFGGTDVTPEIAIKLGLKEAKGFLVIDIVMGSPANKADIRGGDMPVAIGDIPGFRGHGPGNLLRLGGDIITRVDNQTVNKIDDLLSYIEGNKKAGDTITLMALRNGDMMPIDLVLGARPSS